MTIGRRSFPFPEIAHDMPITRHEFLNRDAVGFPAGVASRPAGFPYGSLKRQR